jgi:hypothetical protein
LGTLIHVENGHRWLALVLLAGCGEAHGLEEGGPDSCETGETLRFELFLTDYGREDAEGRVAGMNLDGRISDVTDGASCHQVDFVGVDGEEGVDNQLAATLGVGLESDPYLIETGPVPLVLGGVDDRQNDRCITFRLGDGAPVETELVEGRFHAQGTGTLIVSVGDHWWMTMSTFPVRALSAKGRLDESGALSNVVVGARMDIEQTIAHVMSEAPDVDPALVRTTLEGIADLDPDTEGACQSVSAGFLAEAR